jgi:hypothetical protein
MSKFKNINYHIYNFDILLDIYSKQRKDIVAAVYNNPQSLINIYNDILSYDKYCSTQGTEICTQCKVVNRLKREKEDYFIVDYGKLAGTKIKIEQITDLNKIYVIYSKNKNLLTGDKFTINFIISCLVENCLKNYNHNILSAFVCFSREKNSFSPIGTNIRYSCKEYKDFFSANDTTGVVAGKEIIKQLVVILLKLREINFIHGNATVDSLFFSNEPISFEYNNKNIESKFTLCLNNFDKSSVKIGNLLIQLSDSPDSLNNRPERNIKEKQFTIMVCNESGKLMQCKEEIFTCQLYEDFYSNETIDMYSFFISLMKQRNFYNQVNNSEELLNLWNSIWLPEQIPTYENLQELSIQEILHNKWLRKNILSHIFNTF